MSEDIYAQEDELLALASIFSPEEFIRERSRSGGEIRVSVDLPRLFSVAVRHGDSFREYNILFLPPVELNFDLPSDYPSTSPPSFTVTCSWLSHTQLSSVSASLSDLWQDTRGSVVIFSWVQFLREELLSFLRIRSPLELPICSQESPDTTLLDPTTTQVTIVIPVSTEESVSAQEVTLASPSVLASAPEAAPASALEAASAPETAPASAPEAASAPEEAPASALEAASAPEEAPASALEAASAPEEAPASALEAASAPEETPASALETASAPEEAPASALEAASAPGEAPASALEAASAPEKASDTSLLDELLAYDEAQRRKAFEAQVFDCGVCFVARRGSDCVELRGCGHVYCNPCMAEFCQVQITEGNVHRVTCPEPECSSTPTPAQVRRLVGEELFDRYDRLLFQSSLDSMSDVVYCPRRSCDSPVLLEKGSKAAVCPACRYPFCATCRKIYHGTTKCKEVRRKPGDWEKDERDGYVDVPQTEEGLQALWNDYSSGSVERRKLLEKRYGKSILLSNVEHFLSESWITTNSKLCPQCTAKIEKVSGCNKMTCFKCGQNFCWSCLAKMSSKNPYEHFDDPSNDCTH